MYLKKKEFQRWQGKKREGPVQMFYKLYELVYPAKL